MIHQTSRPQDRAIHDLATIGRLSIGTHTRTRKSLERAGLIVEDDAGWKLTPAGEREAERARDRLTRRIS